MLLHGQAFAVDIDDLESAVVCNDVLPPRRRYDRKLEMDSWPLLWTLLSFMH